MFWQSGSGGRSPKLGHGRSILQGRALTYVLLLLITLPGQVLWLFRGLNPAEKLGCEAIVLAIAAVVVAVRHANGLETVAGELRGLARSVPTRGIGVFPNYMAEVAELVSRATENVTILCDTPAHGAFSNSAAFDEYWTKLRHILVDGEVSITCTFFNAAGREQLHQAQIASDAANWKGWKKRNRANCDAFDELARAAGVNPPHATTVQRPERKTKNNSGEKDRVAAWADTPEVYVASMMAINEAVLSSFSGQVEVEELRFGDPLHEGPSVYFWLRDYDQEAVFVIVPVRGIGVRDLAGFHTRERELIRALGTVFDHRSEPR